MNDYDTGCNGELPVAPLPKDDLVAELRTAHAEYASTLTFPDQATSLHLMAADRIEKLQELVVHCWIHSSYFNCGYDQMTTEQKIMYDKLLAEASH